MFTTSKRWIKRLLISSITLIFLLIGLIIFFSSFGSTHVFADGVPGMIPGLGVATIDGIIDPSEWSTASTYNQLMTFTEPYLDGTIYVMQDNSSIYLGFTLDDDEFTTHYINGLYGDTLIFEFDDNNSGSLWEIGENKLSIYATDPWWVDAYFVNVSGSSSQDTQQDGIGRSSRQGNLNHYELQFPLCSGDSEDFCLSPGNVVGLRLKYYDVYPVDDSFAYVANFLPSSSTSSLITITVQDWDNIYLPLVSK